MKNLFILFAIAFTVYFTSCNDKKDDPQPVTPTGPTTSYPLDTASIQNVWWVEVVTSGSQTWYYEYLFNSNDTYIYKTIFEDSQFASSDTTIGTGIYYFDLQGSPQVPFINLKGTGATQYTPISIKLTPTNQLNLGGDLYNK